MPKTSHWLAPLALISFALTALLSVYAALRPGAPVWLLLFAVLAPLSAWFVAARQAQSAAEARQIANQAAAVVKRLAESAGVNANRPSEALAEAIADQDAANRNAVINQLTQVYVLMHDDVSQSIIEGSEPAPLEWLNEGLEKLGVNWRVRITNDGELESYTP